MAMNTDLMFYMVVLLVILTVIILIISIIIASKVDTCAGGKRFVGAKKSQIMETNLANYRDVDAQTHQPIRMNPGATNYTYKNTNKLTRTPNKRATVNDYIKRLPELAGIGKKVSKSQTTEKLDTISTDPLEDPVQIKPILKASPASIESMDTSEQVEQIEKVNEKDQVDEVKRLHKLIDKIDDSVNRLETDISLSNTTTLTTKNVSKSNPNRSSPILAKRSVTPSNQKMVTFASNDTSSSTTPGSESNKSATSGNSDRSFEKIKLNIKN